ncbi:GYF domain-containing protein [Roseibacillus ishigakijimensis]|uniref:DUF4339 domain-containing protein n=1 Tax=Roseibacillus ishigakijimensis TaxID=454146 RepID=A0A934VM42_9BACT|nr:GYF domain-containing protein [Roseibacillus ishigakijimensis]MBK1833882.1 DUF4339 domain-containing protein [Roseibacillus ishigakijimensis]
MWYYEKNGTQQGPIEAARLAELREVGEVSATTLVWRQGMADWTPLGQVAEFASGPGQGGPGNPYQVSSPSIAPSPGAPGVGVAPQNGMALASLILGISGILALLMCFGFVLAVPAVICGHLARTQIRDSSYPQSGDGLALAGLILGYTTLVLNFAPILFGLIAVGVGAWNA